MIQLLHTKRVLSGWPSIFLDGIRFLAAFAVLVIHCRAIWFPETELDLLSSNLSHGAVVIFFVLSGFVIAHTTSNNNRSAKEYAIARLSRLYSVFLPAIVITAICALIIRMAAPDTYVRYEQNNTLIRYIASFFFVMKFGFFHLLLL